MEQENFTADDAIKEERVSVFFESLRKENPPFLWDLEKQALADHIPVIRSDTQSLLQFFLKMKKPGHILEVGTAEGFSAIFMSWVLQGNVRIDTIELDPDRAEKARTHFAQQGLDDRIRSIIGDAAGILPTLTGPYDFIFMDAAKGQYIHYLPQIKRLLPAGGILFSDNILKEGEILQSRFAVKRRNRTIHRRMREYLQALAQDEDFTTLFLQEGDGAAICMKNT